MALFAIGDLHLSQGVNKPMDIFSGWENHTQRLCDNWVKAVSESDTVVICGDVTWAMSLDEALPDFKLIEALPGKRKIILKGNHDYWWTSASKIMSFFAVHGLSTLSLLHNNAYEAEGFVLCGSRGWIFENGQPHDEKIINREAMRMELSIKAAEGLCGERLMFLHYPPVFAGQELTAYTSLMAKHGIRRCFYGHIHGAGHKNAVHGQYKGIYFTLISSDYLGFCPFLVEKKL